MSIEDRINLNHTLYVLSHDLKNDILSLSGLISLLKMRHEDIWDANDLETFTMLQEVVDNYDTLLNRLLEVSRINTRGQAGTVQRNYTSKIRNRQRHRVCFQITDRWTIKSLTQYE